MTDMAKNANIAQKIISKIEDIMGIFPEMAFEIFEPTNQVIIMIITRTRVLTNPNMFRGLLYITKAQTTTVIIVPYHNTGFMALNTLRVISSISSDFRDFSIRVKRTIRLPSARIIPKNSKKNGGDWFGKELLF